VGVCFPLSATALCLCVNVDFLINWIIAVCMKVPITHTQLSLVSVAINGVGQNHVDVCVYVHHLRLTHNTAT